MSDFNGQLSSKTFNGEEFISWNKHHKFLNLMNKIKRLDEWVEITKQISQLLLVLV